MLKLVVLLILLLIVISLGSALYHMSHGTEPSKMARALTYRIGLSVALFVLLLVFYALGWIEPHGLMPR